MPVDVALAVFLFLPELVLVETPDAAGCLEQRTRILTRDLRPAIGLLARVRRRTDVHVHPASVRRRRAPCPRAGARSGSPSAIDGSGRSASASARRPAACSGRPSSVVASRQVAVAQARRRCTPVSPKCSRLVELAVAVACRAARRRRRLVPPRPSASRRSTIAVRRDRQMTRAHRDRSRDDRRAESLRQLEAAVVGIARRRRGGAGKRHDTDDGNRRRNPPAIRRFMRMIMRSPAWVTTIRNSCISRSRCSSSASCSAPSH